jgi:hypothetical protein
MMTLYEAAKFFDAEVFEDVFDDRVRFSGQFLPFPDSRNSGPSTRRRILETAPGVILPAKGTFREINSGEVFIAAGATYDSFHGRNIRAKRPVTTAVGMYSYGTPGQILANTPAGSDLYLDLNYIRRFIHEDQATYDSGYELVFHSSYIVNRDYVVTNGTKYYQAMQDSHVEHSGFEICEAVELYNPKITATISAQGTTYNATTDTYTQTSYSNVPIFIVNGILEYHHEALGFVPIEAGDKTISVLKSAVPSLGVGSKVNSYKVISVSDKGTYWLCHGRRV